MRRRCVASIGGLLAFVLILSIAVGGGFKYPIDASQYEYDGHSLGDSTPAGNSKEAKANDTRTKGARDKIKADLKWDAKTDDEAKAKLKQARDRVQQALDWLALDIPVQSESKTIADGLKELLKQGLLNIDFKFTESAAARDDGQAGISQRDKVNVGSEVLRKADGVLHSPSTLSLILLLLHEGTHANEQNANTADPDPNRKKVNTNLNACTQEDLASGAEEELINDVLAGLDNLEDPKKPPAKSGLTKAIIASIKSLKTADEQAAAIKALRDRAEEELSQIEILRAIYAQAIAAKKKFLCGRLAKDDLNTELKKIDKKGYILWWVDPVDWPAPPKKDSLIVPSEADGQIDQMIGGDVFVLTTPFIGVMDLLLVQCNYLLVTGIREDGETGAIVGYLDSDRDGVFEESELVEMDFSPAPSALSLDLFETSDGRCVFVFDGGSRSIRQVVDYNGDGIFDSLGPDVASEIEIPDDVLSFFAASAYEFYGSIYEGLLPSFPSEGESPIEDTFILTDTDGDGLLDDVKAVSFVDLIAFEPVILSDLKSGTSSAIVQASSGSAIRIGILDSDGAMGEVLAEAVAASTAPFEVTFARALRTVDVLVIEDLTHGLLGPIYDVCADISTCGGDPPIWGVIAVFPTPERFLNVDLNGDGDTGDTVLRYKDLGTGAVVNTGLECSGADHGLDIWENLIVFSSAPPSQAIMIYDIGTGTVRDTGCVGHHPSIHSGWVAFAAFNGTLGLYEVTTGRTVATGVLGSFPAIHDGVVAFESGSPRTIWYYDVAAGTAHDTGAAGARPAIYDNLIVFSTSEWECQEDLNGDGDYRDRVLHCYDLATHVASNSGVSGDWPAIFGSTVVFGTSEAAVQADLNGDGRISGSVIQVLDLSSGRVTNTGQLGSVPDIYEGTISFHALETWSGLDWSGDGDLLDSVVLTYALPSISDAPGIGAAASEEPSPEARLP